MKAVEHLRIFAILFGVAGVRAERERGGGRRGEKHPGTHNRKNGDDGDEQFYDGVS